MEDHEVFSARIPFCKDMEQKLAERYSESTTVIQEALEYLRSHKIYKEYEKQNYPSYDLEGSPCNKVKGTSPKVISRHRIRTETLHKPTIRMRHTRCLPTTKKRLEAIV